MGGRDEEADPGDVGRVLRAGQRGSDAPAVFQYPVMRGAKPIQRSAPVEVAVDARLEIHEVGNLLLVGLDGRSYLQVDRYHVLKRRKNLRMRSKRDGLDLASTEPTMLSAD